MSASQNWEDVYLTQTARIAEQAAEIAALRSFCQDIFKDWPEDWDVDGFELQKLAIKYGLLRPIIAAERCGENCSCANESDFPTTCYRKTSLFSGKTESDAAIDALLAKGHPVRIVPESEGE